jgi:phenylacetate-CoA ligase
MCHERGLAWGGLSPDEPRVNLFGGSLGVEKTGLMTRLGGLLRQDLFLPAFELRTDTAGSFFEKIRGSKSRFLLGYTSAVYRLAVLAEEMHQELAFEAVFPTAELLLPQWKEVIERVFHCAVLPYYGCGEVNALGYQVRGADHYYIPEEHALIEVWEKDGSTRLCGEGSFVITDLDNYAMPFLRYVNGDAGKISCAQGEVPLSRIERLDGRYNSLLMTDTGELISGAIGPHIFRHVPSVQIYRIIQEEPLRIVIKIVPKSDFSEEDRRLIINLLGRHLGSNMKITIEKVPDLPVPPSGKSVFVINHCLSSPDPF